MYSFGKTSFSSFIWIKDGALFSDVTLVEIEMIDTGAFRLEVVDQAGAVIGSARTDNPRAGWNAFHFLFDVRPPVAAGAAYKLRLVNEAPGVRNVRQGRVTQHDE